MTLSEEVRHGRAGTYNSGCRCEACRLAAVEYRRKYKRTRLSGKVTPPGGQPFKPRPEHGVRSYKLGCRCDVCRSASNAQRRAYRKRTGR